MNAADTDGALPARPSPCSKAGSLEEAGSEAYQHLSPSWKNPPSLAECSSQRVFSRCSLGASSQHEANHRDVNHRLAGSWQGLVILAQAPIAGEPPQGPFDDPALRLDDKPADLLGALDEIQAQRMAWAEPCKPANQGAGVPAVGPNQLHPHEAVHEVLQHAFCPVRNWGGLLRTSQEHFPAWYPLVSLLARTGVRIGEACALQWGNLDFHGRFIEVRRNCVRYRITTPKSGKTRRVDMSQGLTETLRTLHLECKKESLRKGWGEVPEWVFYHRERALVDQHHFRGRVWPKILAKAGLRQVRIHDLRHTFASLLIQQGESLAYVKDQMGHHSIRITVDTYGHLVPGGNRQAVDRLDGLENATIRNLSATTPANPVLKRVGNN